MRCTLPKHSPIMQRENKPTLTLKKREFCGRGVLLRLSLPLSTDKVELNDFREEWRMAKYRWGGQVHACHFRMFRLFHGAGFGDVRRSLYLNTT